MKYEDAVRTRITTNITEAQGPSRSVTGHGASDFTIQRTPLSSNVYFSAAVLLCVVGCLVTDLRDDYQTRWSGLRFLN